MTNRIRKGTKSMKTMIAVLVENNSDANTVCQKVVEASVKAGMPEVSLLFLSMLDSMEIYGYRIHLLWLHIFDQELYKVMDIIAAIKTDKITKEVLDHAIDNNGEGIDVDAVIGIPPKACADEL